MPFLDYQPPFAWPEMLAFLERRAVVGVEAIVDGAYLRTVESGPHRGWLRVSHEPAKSRLVVQLSPTLRPARSAVLAGLAELFDVRMDPAAVASALGPLAAACPGLRVPGAFDSFEIAVRAILGQQVTVAAATTLARRFAQRFGQPVECTLAALDRLTPRAADVARATVDELGQLGIIRARGGAIVALAAAMQQGDLVLSPGRPPVETMAQLRTIPGIGDWTAHYIALRTLGWRDAFPAGDIALQKAAGGLGAKQLAAHAEQWRPWRAYAVLHLWQSLGAALPPRRGSVSRPPRD